MRIVLSFSDGITEDQYARIAYLPVQRGNDASAQRHPLRGRDGCKWRGLPARYGNWHTIYMRMNRWSKSGVLDRVFEQLQRQRIVRLEAVSLDSTIVKVHPDGTGALKKTDPSRSSRGGWTTKLHMVAADARTAVTFSLSPGQAHDAPEGRKLLRRLGHQRADRRTAPTKGTRHANWHSTSASHPSFRHSRPGGNPGCTTGRYTSGATKSNVCSDG